MSMNLLCNDVYDSINTLCSKRIQFHVAFTGTENYSIGVRVLAAFYWYQYTGCLHVEVL
jgi:hypothetical protein